MIETEKVSNVASQIPVILGRPFFTTTNALINCRNGMMRLSFDNMTLELNIFNLERKPSSFDDTEFSTLNWVEDSVLDDAFDGVFAAEYESFIIDDEPEYDVFKYDDLCSIVDCLLTAAPEYVYEFVFPLALELCNAP